MSGQLRNNGFSLTEVLMAAGILAIGFAFIAGMFPVGIKLTALATEQTIAPIVVDEAIAKIKLYGEMYNASPTDPNSLIYKLTIAAGAGNRYVDFSDVLPDVPRGEFTYPSTDISPEPKKYNWSALCGLQLDGNIHITIFVSRKAGAGARYRTHNFDYTQANYGQLGPADGDWPVPVKVKVNMVGPKRLSIDNFALEGTFINTGSTIVDNQFDVVKETWQIYRVLERDSNIPDEIILDRKWEGLATGYVWVVPPAEGSGRNPCIGVYQMVIGL